MRSRLSPTRRWIRRIQRGLNAPEKWAAATGLRRVEREALPHFLGIGAMKAGTTWLDRNLRAHPDLFLPRLKELHYFDRDYHRTLAYYARKFAPGRGRVTGEITPAYAILPIERIRFIRAVMPDVRLIFLMRNPIDRAWSHVLMKHVTRAGRRFEEVSPEELERHLRAPGARRRSDYVETLDKWLSVFPEEQLLLGYFEDLRDRPRELLEAVFRHLGVTCEIDWESLPYQRVIHRGLGAPMPDQSREVLEELLADDIERLHARLGDRVAAWRCGRPVAAADPAPSE